MRNPPNLAIRAAASGGRAGRAAAAWLEAERGLVCAERCAGLPPEAKAAGHWHVEDAAGRPVLAGATHAEIAAHAEALGWRCPRFNRRVEVVI